ncbi:MAG: FAD-dependent oxidoreductase, partial [Gammaproteobacteria bacterium]|nr:FAD-dependent oxidoreductase [Gammaproteobacteria bacterium]
MNIVEGKTKYWEADLVFLALGFIGPDQKVIKEMGINLDERGNISATHGSFETNKEGIFAAGDCRRGQSLVVWAMNEGRGAALSIDRYLQGTSSLSAPTIKLGSEDN